METSYGNIPDIAIFKIVKQDAICRHNPNIFEWLVQITPDHAHELIRNLPKTSPHIWSVELQVNNIKYSTNEQRYEYVCNQAIDAWIEYWGPKKYIEIKSSDYYFILSGAL
jgi:hypothetical protein